MRRRITAVNVSSAATAAIVARRAETVCPVVLSPCRGRRADSQTRALHSGLPRRARIRHRHVGRVRRPVFVTTTVCRNPAGGRKLPSVLVTASAAARQPSPLSNPLAGGDAGSVAVAVLTSGFVDMPEANATGTVNTILLAPPAPMVAPVVPNVDCPVVPVTAPQVAAPVGTHVAFALRVTPPGNGSETVTLLALEGPALVTVTVYVAIPPGVYVRLPSVLATASAATAASVAVGGDRDGRRGSVAVAVFTSGLVIMPAENDTGAVKVSVLPAPAAMVARWCRNSTDRRAGDRAAAGGARGTGGIRRQGHAAGQRVETVTLLAFVGPALATTTV